ncbi:prefoldin subunit beta [Candidatus Woesearchaeota archaeon]|nr:prefoldin subunit beta [Candidatus Woesearchaeota archaeon]
MDKTTQDKIQQLQMIEQGMQNFLMQKQQVQAQLIEIESALKELEKTDEAFKIVGNVMVKSSKEDLKKDLASKKEILDLRIKTLEKQEKDMKDKASAMQSEVMEKLKK